MNYTTCVTYIEKKNKNLFLTFYLIEDANKTFFLAGVALKVMPQPITLASIHLSLYLEDGERRYGEGASLARYCPAARVQG